MNIPPSPPAPPGPNVSGLVDAGRTRREWKQLRWWQLAFAFARRVFSAVAAGLLTVAWLVPIVASLTMVAAQIEPRWLSIGDWQSLSVGLAAAGVFWIVSGIVALPLALARHVNPRSWATMQARVASIEARTGLTGGSRGRGDLEAQMHLTHLKLAEADTWPALRWATRGGYIDLWNRIHRAEEALIEAASAVALKQIADRDRLRLEGAFEISPTLAQLLVDVTWWLTPGGRRWSRMAGISALRSLLSGLRPVKASERPIDLLSVPPVTSLEEAQARLRLVTTAINAFREKNWAGLIQLRNRTVSALLITETVAYGLLALAIGTPVSNHVLVTAVVYFLVAAMVGLLNHVIQLRRSSIAVEDYGLEEARLKLLPAVAGLAGVAGVMFIAILTNPAVVNAIRPSGEAGLVAPPDWDKIFSLSQNPLGLIVAAIFGLTPSLLVSRIRDLATTYERAIRSTQEAAPLELIEDARRHT
jgi:hypothetical protein